MNLSTLEIRILLKCNEGMLKRGYVSQLYQKHSAADRKKAIDSLIKLCFIRAREMPKPGANKVPVFYEITNKGKAWVKNYLNNYPV